MMRPTPLPDMSFRDARSVRSPSFGELLRRFTEGGPSPARGLVFGLLFSALLWAALIGFFLAF